MGDPAGVGPELCLAALSAFADDSGITPIIVGDLAILRRVASTLGTTIPDVRVWVPDEFEQRWNACVADSGQQSPEFEPGIIDVQAIEVGQFTPGTIGPSTGRAAYTYLKRAIDWTMRGLVDAIVTGPIHKEALALAGIDYPGHTEILAERTGTAKYCMMLTSPEITCSLVTTHIGFRDIVGQLSADKILDVLSLTRDTMSHLRRRDVRLAVCGLNPHGGENGLFGDEEKRIIQPAVAEARRMGIDVIGPLPADTAFVPAVRREVDAYICMYHDQGLIPLKALAFDEAVNVTLGLPIIRTSVDHGTALDIAWKGVVRQSSMMHAIRLAAELDRGAEPTNP
jgi:4-hydroxythreonine-4-phosphate dehydrogenase